MGIDFIYPEYEVARDLARCTRCGVCVAQCSNGVHIRREGNGALLSDDTKCVNCQRCVAFCPTRALKIVTSGCTFRENANWDSGTVREVYLPGDQPLHRSPAGTHGDPGVPGEEARLPHPG